MFRRRGFWIWLLIIVIVAGGGYYYWDSQQVEAVEDGEPEIQTSLVRRGEIVVSASGAGTVVAASEVVVGFQSGGTLAELLVSVGGEVRAGDVLARLDDSDAQQAVVQAELGVAVTAVQLSGPVVDRTVALAQINVDQAEINLAIAQSDLDDLLAWEPDADAIAIAQASLEAAQASYDSAATRDSTAGSSLVSASISIEQAQRALAEAQDAYDVAHDPGRDWELGDSRKAEALERERENTTSTLLRAQENLQIAQANYASSSGNLNTNNAVSAQTAVLNAEMSLEMAQTGPADDDVETAQIKVAQMELVLQQAQLNLQAAQDNTQAELSLAQAELSLQNAEQALVDTVLVAPVGGTVVALTAAVGEAVSSAPFITLADLEQPLLEVYLDETDLDKAGVGFEVEVIFDALPDEVYLGTVVQVDPMLVVQGGVTAVRTLVQLDNFNLPQTLPVGMNAAVEVVGGRATNALLVPVESLREISPDEFAIFVMEDDEPKLRFVEVGLMDFTFAEIISGVEQGETVTTGILETGN